MTQIAKQTILLILIAVTLGLAFVVFTLSEFSLAWFADNDEVTASELSVKANGSPNLIIEKSADELLNDEFDFVINFEGMTRSNMVAVTRDESVADTMLKYLTNPHAVDSITGNVKDGMDLTFEPVPATENDQYFIDYTVYIASAIKPLEVSSLLASIIKPSFVDETQPYFNAVSIDFYVDEVSIAGYRGTTSVATHASVDLLPGGATIPLNTSGNYIKVIMRCYFDGALQDTETNKAYINSYTVSTDNVVIGVSFFAVDIVTAE